MNASRLRRELRAYAVTVVYLYVWFGALLLYKTAVLREAGLAGLPYGFALAKALILGKFVLLGESAGVGTRLAATTLLHRIVQRVIFLLLLLAALTVLEEFAAGWVHGRSAAETLAALEARSLLELGATCLLVGLVLVPFIGVEELGRALGPGGLRRVLLGRPRGDGR